MRTAVVAPSRHQERFVASCLKAVAVVRWR